MYKYIQVCRDSAKQKYFTLSVHTDAGLTLEIDQWK